MIRHLRADARLWWGAMVTSWFWLVGIVVLSLLPPLIKTLIGGNEDTVTAYLALFSIAVGVGSALAAAIARGRIVLRTTLAGARAARRLRARSGHGDLGRGAGAFAASAGRGVFIRAGHSRRDRSGRAGDCRRAVHRAGLRRGAGLGRRRLSRAHGGGGQRAQRGFHDRRDGRRCDHAEIRRHRAGAVSGVSAWRRFWSRWRSGGRCRRPRDQNYVFFFRIFSTRSTISPATPR